MTMPVNLTAVKCPSCGRNITDHQIDRAFLCDCGIMHTRDDEGTREIPFEVAAPPQGDLPPSGTIYVPFWRLDSEVTINYERSEGGFFHKLFGKDWKGGRLIIFVPAVDWEPGTYKQWSTALTEKPPTYQRAPDFGAFERMPVAIEEGEATQLADFLILTFEAEKPGVLQEISYEVKVVQSGLLYLPFDRSQGGLRPLF